jgi:hypothetical protein
MKPSDSALDEQQAKTSPIETYNPWELKFGSHYEAPRLSRKKHWTLEDRPLGGEARHA